MTLLSAGELTDPQSVWSLRPGAIPQTKILPTPVGGSLYIYDNVYVKPGVHTNDFAPIHRLRALKLGHASLATVFRPGRLTLQPILLENLDVAGLKVSANHNRCRYWCVSKHQMAPWCIHISCLERVARSGSGRDSVRGLVGAMDAELSRPDWLATVQSGRKQVQSRVCTPSFL